MKVLHSTKTNLYNTGILTSIVFALILGGFQVVQAETDDRPTGAPAITPRPALRKEAVEARKEIRKDAQEDRKNIREDFKASRASTTAAIKANREELQNDIKEKRDELKKKLDTLKKEKKQKNAQILGIFRYRPS